MIILGNCFYFFIIISTYIYIIGQFKRKINHKFRNNS